MRSLWLILVLAALLVVARLSLFTIDATEYGYVTILGRYVTTLDGSGDGAGLHVGWPWPFQSVERLDRRLQYFDLAPMEVLTPDPKGEAVDKNLAVEACVFWRLADADAVNRFVRTMGNADQARNILGAQLSSRLSTLLSRTPLNELVSTARSPRDPTLSQVDVTLEKLRTALLSSLAGDLHARYGIELVDLRLKRYNYPSATRPAIFDLIRSERRKKRTEYEAEGERKAKEIESSAQKQYREKIAQARLEEERIKSEADAEAMAIRNRAYSQDPEFYAFLKKMEQYQSMLAEGKGILLLSTHRPMFDLLFSPPKASPGASAPGVAPAEKK